MSKPIMLKATIATWCSLALFCGATQARTSNDLILDLRIKLGQTDSLPGRTNWTNDQLRRILEMAQDNISALGRVIERDTTYLVSATRSYAPPSGFITLRGNAYLVRNGISVKPIPLIGQDSLPKVLDRLTAQASGDDELYLFEEAGRIRAEPAMLSQDSLKIVCYSNPAAIGSGTTECQYGDEWEMILLMEAKLIACEKSKEEAWYQLEVVERDKKLAQMYQQTRLRPQLVTTP